MDEKMKEKLLVSACLLGEACRYDGRSVPNEDVMALGEKYELIPICPECLGGLPTPRTPSERVGDRVFMKDGTDVTLEYTRGAMTALVICLKNGVKTAILKERSPSCGSSKIYDGSFTGALVEGEGVTAELFSECGIRVLSESELSKLED